MSYSPTVESEISGLLKKVKETKREIADLGGPRERDVWTWEKKTIILGGEGGTHTRKVCRQQGVGEEMDLCFSPALATL